MTQDFLEAMKADGMNVRAHRLAVKGWIVDPQECLAAGQAVTRRGEDAGRSLAARGEKTTAEVALFGAISDRVRSVRVRSGKLLTQWLENVSPTDRPGALQDLEALAKELLDLPDQWRHLLRRVHEWLGSNKVIEPNLLRSKLELLLLIDQTTLQEMSRTFSIVSAPQGTLSDGLIAQLNEAATELETLGKETFRHWHKFTTAQEDAARAEMKQGGVEADELFASVAGVTTEEWRKRVANKRATIPQDAGGA